MVCKAAFVPGSDSGSWDGFAQSDYTEYDSEVPLEFQAKSELKISPILVQTKTDLFKTTVL